MTAINYVGIKTTSIIQTIVSLAILAIGIMFVTGALMNGDAANMGPVMKDNDLGLMVTGMMGVAVMVPISTGLSLRCSMISVTSLLLIIMTNTPRLF